MYSRIWLHLVVFCLLAASVAGQESVTDLKGPGDHGKFLTPGQLDRWIFDGEKGETIIAHVRSREFDPVLELAKTGAKDNDSVLVQVDDPGNESSYAFRLPETGQYKIRVHAFQNQGGGNYILNVRRFHAQPLAVGKSIVGTFDRAGKSYLQFTGAKDQIVRPDLKGTSEESSKILDTKGRPLAPWAGSVLLEENGEYILELSGNADHRFEVLVRAARQHDLVEGKERSGQLGQGEVEVVNIQGKPGDFRVLEAEKTGDLRSRFVFAPMDKKREQVLSASPQMPEIEFLPIGSRGGKLRYAVILGRTGRYQLQLLATTKASYTLTARDASVPLATGKEIDGNLEVGGAAFYSFQASPGQLFQADLASQKFVSVLRLYDPQGTLVGSSDDDADGPEGRLAHMVLTDGTYRLQVSSLGDGGGGEFRLSLAELKLKELKIGERGEGTVQPGAMEYWSFAGQEGKTVFLSVRSNAFIPTVSLRSPDGVVLVAENNGDPITGSLFALKLPKSGRYTVWISSSRGSGEYAVRIIDGD